MGEHPQVVAVARNAQHQFSKEVHSSIRLLAGLGVEGDAHCGQKVKHRSRVAIDPDQPNLRQVHLLPSELLDELATKGFDIARGALGENILTQGLDLVELPQRTVLKLGEHTEVEITGLRNPCNQIEKFRSGLLAQVVGKSLSGEIERKAGVMGIVIAGGEVRPGDPISVEFPPKPHEKLERV